MAAAVAAPVQAGADRPARASAALTALRAAREAAHACTGLAWRAGLSDAARLAKTGEAVLKSAIAQAEEDIFLGAAPTRGRPGGGRRKRGAGSGGGGGGASFPGDAAQASTAPSEPSESATELLTDDPLGYRGGPAVRSHPLGAQEEKHEFIKKEEGAEQVSGSRTNSVGAGTQTCSPTTRSFGVATTRTVSASCGVQVSGGRTRFDSSWITEAPSELEAGLGKPRRQLAIQLSDASTVPSITETTAVSEGAGASVSVAPEGGAAELSPAEMGAAAPGGRAGLAALAMPPVPAPGLPVAPSAPPTKPAPSVPVDYTRRSHSSKEYQVWFHACLPGYIKTTGYDLEECDVCDKKVEGRPIFKRRLPLYIGKCTHCYNHGLGDGLLELLGGEGQQF